MVLLVTTMSAQKQAAFRTLQIEQEPARATSPEQGDSTNRTFEQMMADAMKVMDRDMYRMAGMGDPDQQFAMMMVPHHQSAIDMAKAELLYGKDVQLRRLAQEIITDQQNEIRAMNLWLAQHPVKQSAGHGRLMQK